MATRNSPRSIEPNRRAVLYLRVSDPRQVETYSLETQEAACREYCQRQGWEIVAVFREEGESAKTADRTELKRLLAWCGGRKRKADYVVVYRLSRSARDVGDYHALKAWFERREMAIRTVMESGIDDSPQGRLLENMLAAINQFENEVRAEQCVTGMRHAAQLGRWVWRAPVGYRNVRLVSGLKTIEPDPAKAPLVKRAFELAASRISVAEVIKRVHERGLASSTGRPLAQSYIRKNIFHNPLYCGRLVVPKWKIDREGTWEPIVSRDLWNRVQLAIDGRSKPSQVHTIHRPDFPLRRFVRCGSCDGQVTASWSKGRSRRYPYYHCTRCNDLRIRKEQLEDDFVALLRHLRPKPETRILFREVVHDTWTRREAEAEALREAARKRLVLLAAKRERLVDGYLEGFIDRGIYERKLASIATDMAAAEQDAARTDAENALDAATVVAHADEFLADCDGIWERGTLEIRQRFQTLVFPEGLAYLPKRGFGTAVTLGIFRDLRALETPKGEMVHPGGVEPPTS